MVVVDPLCGAATAASGAAVGVALQQATSTLGRVSLTEEATNHLLSGPWRSDNKVAAAAIKNALKKRFLFDIDGKVDHYLRRPDYAESPILKYMLQESPSPGVVYVAYVPSCMGKTTACVAFIEKMCRTGEVANNGICFCPTDRKVSYLRNMLSLLGLSDHENVPSGFIHGLVSALELEEESEEPSYLLLDDFMPPPLNAADRAIDEDLVRVIKTAVRNSNVAVVIMTANRDCADILLGLNNLRGVQPLVRNSQLNDIRRKCYEGGVLPKDFMIDWNEYMNMKWESDALVNAAMTHPHLPKGVTDAQVRDYVDGISDEEERNDVIPNRIVEYFRSMQRVKPGNVLLPLEESESPSRGGFRWPNMNCGGDAGCTTM